ncbi:MAG: hypothetical protein ACSHXD_19415 [Marinosulfonomonas sp.]
MSEPQVEVLENDTVKLVVMPSLGARVVELCDKRTGRNWLTTGSDITKTLDATTFGGEQSIGWDECFPSIAQTPNPTPNRDHGDLWGRGHEVRCDKDSLTSVFTCSEYRFARDLILDKDCVTARYRVSRPLSAKQPFPYLWSQHCLLGTHPGEKIMLDGVKSPRPALPTEISDLVVQGVSAKQAHKAYGEVEDKARISVSGSNGGIQFSWSAADIPWCGIWLDYGGWPTDAPIHQIAIEPTTAPFEDPQTAMKNGHGRQLEPGQTVEWAMQINVFIS